MNPYAKQQKIQLKINYLEEKIRQCGCINMLHDLDSLKEQLLEAQTEQFNDLKNKINGL